MKLWEKGSKTEKSVLDFTIGKDPCLDLEIAAFDVIASIAHVIMLGSVNLISGEEKKALLRELLMIYGQIEKGDFKIEEGMEDVHSQIEKILTVKLGDSGKKVHTARSRNDQVLADLKLFYRSRTIRLAEMTEELITLMIEKSELNKDVIIPGYTHFQAAMPSSFGLWFGAYAESLTEDLMIQEGIMKYINQNPLGSAAGYGSSFPVDREMTTRLLKFENMHINSINAQMSRGKTEKFVAAGLAAIAGTLSKMAMDMTLFMSQNFGFISLKEEMTTGSSIMPHKKNPDVIELIRARSNRICSVYNEISLLTQNLPSGYHRDFQLLKEIIFPAYNDIFTCIEMIKVVLINIEVKENIIEDARYRYIFSVENINEKVKENIPFREAYMQVANDIDNDRFRRISGITYTHTGSIGNLANELITGKLRKVMKSLGVDKYRTFEKRFISDVKKQK
jgi:argininosuccinate lyase